ncbi:UNVERIFIED_ORG: hypothetical protein ABID33_000269 [Xanthobacter viscosus]|uniref:Uncharacterized protein n=1 Tax=Xanthobacter autotrophicus TaxID=280 RepID=A0A6C1KHS7_XANAU|nr:hypothetical protein [Xanthobacter autotrophicus]TLX43842.1 hypothetical protein FBQ73_07005 [Xanthobacter autotrophicus]
MRTPNLPAASNAAAFLVNEDAGGGVLVTRALPADAVKAAAGLGNVDNTADADKPVSAAQAAAIADSAATRASLGKLEGLVTNSTATRTLALTDLGKAVEMTSGSANTLTVPPNSAVPFPLTTVIPLIQMGAGQTTIAAGAGVTIRSFGGKLKLSGQYAQASLYKRGTDEWVLAGSLVP